MKATVAIRTKCDGVRDLVGTPIRQHFHVVHFEKWRAVVGEKRCLIGAGFAEPFALARTQALIRGYVWESDPVQPKECAALRFGKAKRRAEIG